MFQPGAVFQLTPIRSDLLANQYLSAAAIFGKALNLVAEQLLHAPGYAAMIAIVARYLITLIRKQDPLQHPVDRVSMAMIREQDCFALDRFIREACLSSRQVDRKFNERIGIAPRLFLQMACFHRAFRLKDKYPRKDWLTVALHWGYYDYQHLAKDNRQFTGCTPARFFEINNNAPERLLGDVET